MADHRDDVMIWWIVGGLAFCAFAVGVALIVANRGIDRNPERNERVARAHAELELVEEFDQVTSVREIPPAKGDDDQEGPLGLMVHGSIWIVACEACPDLWWPPYATEEAACRARTEHVGEHVLKVQGEAVRRA